MSSLSMKDVVAKLQQVLLICWSLIGVCGISAMVHTDSATALMQAL